MSERVTIVGAGTVGAHLARALLGAGHDVRFAARDVGSEKVRAVRDELDLDVVPLDAAADGADVVVLAVPFGAVVDTAVAIGDGGHVLVDASNPMGAAFPVGADSTLDLIAAAGVGVPLVKAFNTIGAEAYESPIIDGRPLFLPVAGDEPAAERVRALADSLGFDAVVIGGRAEAGLNEAAAQLWIHLAFRVGLGRDFGFARLQR